MSQILNEMGSLASTTSGNGASGSSSEIQQLRQERDHMNVDGRKSEIDPLACQ